MQLQHVPENYFRLPTYAYSDVVDQEDIRIKFDEEASDELIGYLSSPLMTKPLTFESEDYPKIHISQHQNYKGSIPPIIILKNPEDLALFLSVSKVSEQPISGFAQQTFSKNLNVWFYPTGMAYQAEEGQKAIVPPQKQNEPQKQPEKQQPEEKQPDVQIPKIPKKIVFCVLMIFIAALAFAFKQSESHIFSAENNKLIQRSKILEELSLKANATNEEIKEQYYRLLEKYDINKNPTCSWCEGRTQQVTEAFNKLISGEGKIPTAWGKGDEAVVKGNFK